MKCLICGIEFENNFKLSSHISKTHKIKIKDYYDSYYKKENEGICLNCGKETNFNRLSNGYREFCSKKCLYNSNIRKERIKQTNIHKYGVENPLQNNEIKEKHKQTCLERYGVENPSQSIEIKEKKKLTCLEHYGVENPIQAVIVQEKIKQTNIQKYNVENYSQTIEYKEKVKNTCLEKYNVESYSKTIEYKEKVKNTCLKKYNVEYPSQNKEIREKQKQTNLKKYGVEYVAQNEKIKESVYKKWMMKFNYKLSKLNLTYLMKTDRYFTLRCNNCNKEFNISISGLYAYLNTNNICPYCYPRFNISNEEKKLLEYIKSIYDGEIIENNRSVLGNYELDIYLPNLKIAFEFDGLYWHSDLYKDKNYHLNKTIECEKRDIQLIHIFENEWLEKENKIKEYIKDLINNTVNIEYYNLIFKKEDNKIIVDRRFNNGYLLKSLGYKLIETNECVLNEIEFQNTIYNVYDCGKLIYEKE